MIAMPPDMVRWVARNGEDNDCAVTAISLATGETYEACLVAAHNYGDPDVLTEGLGLREIRRVLSEMGYQTRLHKKFDPDEETGILLVDGPKKNDRHAVYLWDGRIIEPSLGRRSFWLDAETYNKHEGTTLAWLITLVKEGK